MTTTFEYQGKLEGGLHNPHCLVVSQLETSYRYCGLGTKSFIASRVENPIAIPNTFYLKSIEAMHTSGGSIQQGAYLTLKLLSTFTVNNKPYAIHFQISATEFFLTDIAKGSRLEDGKNFIKSEIYSVITHNATPTLVLHDSDAYRSYVADWKKFLATKDAVKETKQKKQAEAQRKFEKGNVYLTIPEHKTDAEGKGTMQLTAYVYLGKELFPSPYVKKQSYMDKGAKKHLFVEISKVYYSSNEPNLLIPKIKRKMETHTCRKEDMEEFNLLAEQGDTVTVIPQPYFYAHKNKEKITEQTLTKFIVEKNKRTPFHSRRNILAYTNAELTEATKVEEGHFPKYQHSIQTLYPTEICIADMQNFERNLRDYTHILYGEKYARTSTFRYYKLRHTISKQPVEEHITNLYRYFLQEHFETISFDTLIKSWRWYELKLPIANNVRKRLLSSSIAFMNLSYVDSTPIQFR